VCVYVCVCVCVYVAVAQSGFRCVPQPSSERLTSASMTSPHMKSYSQHRITESCHTHNNYCSRCAIRASADMSRNESQHITCSHGHNMNESCRTHDMDKACHARNMNEACHTHNNQNGRCGIRASMHV